MKHVQIQIEDGEGGWGAIGDIQLLPDGRVEWTDLKRITNGFVREEFFNPDENRRLRITEPEKFLTTLVQWAGNGRVRAIDMDDPEMAAFVLPQDDAPRKSARPEEIVLFPDYND